MQEQMVVLYESGLSGQKVADKLGISSSYTVYKYLKKQGVKTRSNRENSKKHHVKNRDFFENIDTEEKAYLLGFIYADGYVSTRKPAKYSDYAEKKLGVSVGERDVEVLELLKKCLDTTYPIATYEVKSGYKVGIKYSRIIVNDHKIVDDLVKQGVKYHKSNTLEPPKNIPYHLIRHFIRGYIDGDGSIIINNTKYGLSFNVSMIGTDSVLNYITDYFMENNLIRTRVKHEKRHDYDIVSSCRWGGNIQAKKILDHLYNNSHCYLTRKHDRYLKLCEIM